MTVELDKVYKRFIQSWIVEDFSYTFNSGKVYGIKGQNGSGKSTLLKMISGALPSSKGTIKFNQSGTEIPHNQVFKSIAYYAAGDDVIEEYTADELYDHYYTFKRPTLKKDVFFQKVDLQKHQHKQISSFSAGMRQRMALGLSLFCEASLILFDEPSSYLDNSKRSWFYNNLQSVRSSEKLFIIASNDDHDFHLCDEIIDLRSDKQLITYK